MTGSISDVSESDLKHQYKDLSGAIFMFVKHEIDCIKASAVVNSKRTNIFYIYRDKNNKDRYVISTYDGHVEPYTAIGICDYNDIKKHAELIVNDFKSKFGHIGREYGTPRGFIYQGNKIV